MDYAAGFPKWQLLTAHNFHFHDLSPKHRAKQDYTILLKSRLMKEEIIHEKAK
jgi:hypothetical protein